MEKYSFTKDEIINEIVEDTDIGKEFVETEMVFLRALKDGSLIKEITK